ncbi:dehydrogenase/reductase SDR family member 7B isoform X1 [Chlorocebus sabaeus]|nr:PREDICTED: dehydrogenase/reductase SDR family member 7B isoform X2 [Cercocebus atys]XP_011932624.1 PREDICTED: dehydrogenase/reductase SDR family member 7B isoform X2 [Cercocebus atys]XP_011932625.1 PREDICTED: dehydrogenase/reductase SDR family member 7B isoform X2 [Cercocebus atys]XP_037843738.1 dehydrogenase/reductase SDR family member 7B isoform X2 [Chlorocebus sabaeus]XP_037843739.1 dehydrogenase/reductase SDR family member 7B isoform X2 [Chlorocebus sabaeus]
MDPIHPAPCLPQAKWSPGPGDQGWPMMCQVLKESQKCTRRKNLPKARAMDFITSTAILPLLFGCLGVFGLFRLLQWVRGKAYLRNAVVVITGATSGLGKECAKVFYAAGAKLVLCGRNGGALEELIRELTASHATKVQTHKPYLVTFDLTDPGAVVAAAAEILQCFGYVDILVNNAGISYRGTIMDTTVDVDKRVMETNYFGPVALTKALLPSMIKRRQGHIVAISSIQGKISIPFRSAYAASKHATQAFFDCLRAEMEQYEIEVTVISPGYIHTNLSVNAITADGSRYGVMDTTTAQGRSPVEVAHDVLAAVGKKKKDVILADLLPSLAIYLRTLAPGLFFSLMASRARKERKSKNC